MRRFCLLSRWLAAAALVHSLALADSGWIVMPASEYASLHARAFPADHAPAAAKVEKTLTRVDYNLTVDGSLASGKATLAVDVMKEGWVQVPVPSGLLVREARLDGKLLSLAAGSGGASPLTALLSKRGRSVLLLDVVLPVSSTGSDEKLSLPASSSGVTSASVMLPRTGIELHVGGGVLTGQTAGEGGTTWVAYGNPNQPLTFTWHKQRVETPAASVPLRYRGSLTELVGLGEDASSVYAEIAADVVQGAMTEVRIAVPPGVTVNQVLGGSVGDWDVREGVLAVHLLEPAEKSARFMISGETRLPREGGVEIPLLRLTGAERDEGGVAAEVIGAGEMKNVKSTGLENADASQLGQLVAGRQSPSLVAFRFLPRAAAGDRSLSLNVVRYAQQAVLTANVPEARYRALLAKDGKALVEARYAVRNSQRTFVKIALPANALLWAASVDGRSVRPGRAPDGGLLMPLPKSESGEEAATAAVEVLYLATGPAWTDRGRAGLPLPALDLPVSRTGATLYYPPGFRLNVEPGPFQVQPYQAPAAAGLNEGSHADTGTSPQAVNAAPNDILQQFNSNAAQAASQLLVDKFRARPAGPAAQSGPAKLRFPSLGASIFVESALTGENSASVIAVGYQKERKGGVK